MDSWGSSREVEKLKPIKAEAETACEHLRAAAEEIRQVLGDHVLQQARSHMRRAAEVLEAVALGKRTVK